jgi:hypothetical protein
MCAKQRLVKSQLDLTLLGDLWQIRRSLSILHVMSPWQALSGPLFWSLEVAEPSSPAGARRPGGVLFAAIDGVIGMT